MRVIPLSAEHDPIFCACLGNWSEAIDIDGQRQRMDPIPTMKMIRKNIAMRIKKLR